MVIRFIDHFKIVIISNYDSFANSYTRLLTGAHTVAVQIYVNLYVNILLGTAK
jgi:hypothetical protein